jgi:hypothetical protein
MCALTGARVPGSFLIPFSLRPHPATDKPWQVPVLGSKDGRRDLAGSYFAATHEAMQYTTGMKFKDYIRTVPPRWKARFPREMFKEVVLRPDLADSVEARLRALVAEEWARAGAGRKSGDGKGEGKEEVGAGSEGGEEDAAEGGIVLWCGKGEVPVDVQKRGAWDLTKLMGETMEELEGVGERDVVVVERTKQTKQLRIWLARLAMYIKT